MRGIIFDSSLEFYIAHIEFLLPEHVIKNDFTSLPLFLVFLDKCSCLSLSLRDLDAYSIG